MLSAAIVESTTKITAVGNIAKQVKRVTVGTIFVVLNCNVVNLTKSKTIDSNDPNTNLF